MPTEISLPFRVDTAGRVVTTSDPDEQVRQHVFALINTHPEERAMVPGYGVDTHAFVFETEEDEESVAAQVFAVVGSAFEEWEPGVQVTGSRLNSSPHGDRQEVLVEYSRRDAADSGTVANANLAVIGPGGVVRDIVRG